MKGLNKIIFNELQLIEMIQYYLEQKYNIDSQATKFKAVDGYNNELQGNVNFQLTIEEKTTEKTVEAVQ